MIFIPTETIVARLRDESAGVWIDLSSNVFPYWLVAKLPINLIRAIDAAAFTFLALWVIDTDDGRFVAFGLAIHDDSVHPKLVYGACRNEQEVDRLRALLDLSSVPLQLHNETQMPLLSLTCSFDRDAAAHVISALPTGEYPLGDGVLLRKRALDILEASLDDNKQLDSRIVAHSQLRLTVVRKEHLTANAIASDCQVAPFNLDQLNQGHELERLTFQMLDELFPFGTFHSPERDHTKGRLEVCDILAVSRVRIVEEEGIFVFQNKAAHVSVEGLARSTERIASSIEKHIFEGLKQTVGAIKKLKSGIQVYKSDGAKIEEDRPEVAAIVEPLDLHQRARNVGYGVILVSELHGGVNWPLVQSKLLEASRETGYFFHVLDLQELHRLVLNANGKAALFESYLIERWKQTVKQKTALVRTRFVLRSSSEND